MQTEQQPLKSLSLILIAALGWASLGPLILLLPSTFSPLAISGVRGIWIAAAFVAIGICRRQKFTFSPVVVCAGVAYGMSALTYIWSLRLLPVAVAAPLHYTSPIILIIGGCLLAARRPSKGNCIAITLSLIGTAILIGQESIDSYNGIALAISSAGFWALYLALQSEISEDDRITAAIVGGSILAAMGLFSIRPTLITPTILLVFTLIGLCSSVLPLLLVARASKVIPSTVTSLVLLTEPAFAAILAYAINNQETTSQVITGLSFLVAGAACGMLTREPARRAYPEASPASIVMQPKHTVLIRNGSARGYEV